MVKLPAVAAVIGHPVSHSLSPAIFSFLAKKTGREVLYQKLQVPPGELKSFVKALAAQKLFTGWNVTIPHKETILRLCSKVSLDAKAIGAGNVVHFQKGKSVAHNTDVYGIRQTLLEQKARVKGKEAVLYGAGGAARAVAYALGQERASRVWVLNRNPARAEALCKHFSKKFQRTRFVTVKSVSEIEAPIALVVNATPAGMKGIAGKFELPAQVARTTLAFDLIYRPANTPFLKEAKRRGLRRVGGLDMLAWQALATWEIWFGKIRGRASLKKALSRRLSRL